MKLEKTWEKASLNTLRVATPNLNLGESGFRFAKRDGGA